MPRPRPVLTRAACALIAASAIGAVAAGPAGAASSTLRATGGPKQSADVCGVARSATVVPVGGRATVAVRAAGASRGRALPVTVARCVDGRFRVVERRQVRGSFGLDTTTDRTYRVRLGSRTAYVRVGQGTPPQGVVRVPVSFRVKNENGTPMPCSAGADGRTYTLRGHLVAPERMLEGGGPRSVTVLTHGHGSSQGVWEASAVPGYDYAGEMAKKGHASVVYDRLGYDTSDLVAGHRVCWGSDATMVAQVLRQMRAGTYGSTGRPAVPFARVGLGGYNQGAYLNEVVGQYFPDAYDALMHLSFNATPYPEFLRSYADDLARCVTGQTVHADDRPGAEDGYNLRLDTKEAFDRSLFFDADPRIRAEQFRNNNPDPCGYPETVAATIVQNFANGGRITAPVLLVMGEKDTNFIQPVAIGVQASQFGASRKLTSVLMPNTGSAVMLDRSAPRFREIAARWLTENGL